MADESHDSPDRTGRRKRPAQTIELTATDITSKAAAGSPEPEAQEARAEQDAARTDQAAAPDKEHETMPNDRRQTPWLPPGTAVPLISAALAACFVVAVLLLILSIASPFRGRDDGLSVISARQSLTEQQLRDLASRPPPAGADTKALDDFSARLGRIESAVSTRLAAIEAGLKTTADSNAAVSRRIEELATALRTQTEAANRRAEELSAALRSQAETAKTRIDELSKAVQQVRKQADAAAAAARSTPEIARADLDKLASRIAGVEQAAKAMETDIAKRATTADDRASRLAIAAMSLRNLVERGEPFVAELAAVRGLAPDAGGLASLEPFARGGVPSSFALARELSVLLPVMTRAAVAAGPEGGFLVKLQANAERLVRIRPVGDAPGTDAASILARVEDKAAQNDIAGALAEIGKLPPEVRAPADDWVRKAQARAAAIDSARQFAASALSALGKS